MKWQHAVVGIVDYQAGNIHSIRSAFDHLGARSFNVIDVADVDRASHLVLPGVGAFGHCAEKLRSTGLIPAIEAAVIERAKPLLGVCVGMQLLADWGEEMGGHAGLGWIGGVVREMGALPPAIRIPHVGWNDVRFEESFGEFGERESADFYFDHSFAFLDPVRGKVIGSFEHGGRFAAIVRRGNVVAAQFHPEKSQAAGLKFLRGFLELEPKC